MVSIQWIPILFVSLLSLPIVRNEMLSIFEKIVPKPTSDDYKGCHYYIVSTIYTCFFDAATAYQVKIIQIKYSIIQIYLKL